MANTIIDLMANNIVIANAHCNGDDDHYRNLRPLILINNDYPLLVYDGMAIDMMMNIVIIDDS